jgi:hypothetical protein
MCVDLGVQMILLKLDIFQTFKELIDHHDLIIRRNALELLQTLVYSMLTLNSLRSFFFVVNIKRYCSQC